jgi:rhomboid protease GluP
VTEPASPQDQPEPQPIARIRPVRAQVRLPERVPFVTYTIIGLTVLVFLLQLMTEDTRLVIANTRCGDLAACLGMKVNNLILAGQWWRFITPVLLHGSLLHIGFNMYALYVLGPEMERHFGHVAFLLLYLASGFAGVVFSFLFTENASLGASTAVFGLMGAHGLFVYRNRKLFGARAQAMLRNIAQIALINLLIGLTPGIDNWGHIGGLLGGALFAYVASPVYSLAGDEFEFHLENRTPDNRAWIAAAISLLVFGALAFTKFS